MTYTHAFLDGTACDLPPRKIVCVGRNYAAHARELGNAVPETPILFMKPATALVPLVGGFSIPAGRGECHHETEITLLIGRQLKHAGEAECLAAIAGIGLGLDLTLRDLQNELKKKGQPWEVAKAFDGAAPLSAFLRPEGFDLDDLRFTLAVNGEVRQCGHSADMITPVLPLLAHISTIFTLEPGDVVMTGTPEGVAPLRVGDVLTLEMDGLKVESAVL
ncbi:MAG: fumarylacetoacetate hydrolase family protein [Moraxellaceae bacterium]|jgi:2-keto-4-pentenoate hydratase/2-oxohepta-3-ene-1,7-dioic acid hydratase in catechol pathway|nr:fumarylacetoacetate hydrolase family protein [Moraxellaceae bacterium]